MSYDQYRPQGFSILPTIVKNLLIINGLFFLATYVLGNSLGINLADKLGLHYFSSEKFALYQIVTYMFMHANIEHIFFNMFALWMFGYMLENYWGPKRFLTFYIVCGIGAAISHYTIFYFSSHELLSMINSYINNPDLNSLKSIMDSAPDLAVSYEKFMLDMAPYQPSAIVEQSVELLSLYKKAYIDSQLIVGASGSVFGILLAFGMLFPNTILYLQFFIPIKAKYFVILYGALELISGIYNRTGDNVAHFAHLGGMLFGFILIKYWQKSRKNFY